MLRSLASRLGPLVLVAVGLVLAHQLVYLVRYGSTYGEALVHAGHGQAWSDAVTVALIAGTILVTVALARLHRLGLLAARARAGGRVGRTRAGQGEPSPDARTLLRGWLVTTAAVAPTVLVALTVQENIEHLAVGLPAPGIGILLGESYPFAVPIVILVSTAVAFVAALLAWRRDVLVAWIEAARRRRAAVPDAPDRPKVPWVERRHAAIVGHQVAGRAPPAGLAA